MSSSVASNGFDFRRTFDVSRISMETRFTALVVAAVAAAGAMLVYTKRPEMLALLAVPVALRMLTSFRTSALVTTCAMLIWFSRLPTTLFDLVLFSYVVYGSIVMTVGAFLLRAAA